MQLVDKNPAKRPQTARELGERLAQIASAAGWAAPSTNPSMHPIRGSGLDVGAAPRVTAPKMREEDARAATMASEHDVRATPAPARTPVPTTLSSAASQSVIMRSARRRTGIMIAAFGASVAVGIAVFMAVKGGGG